MQSHKIQKWIVRCFEALVIGFAGFFLYPFVSDKFTEPIVISPEALYLYPKLGKPTEIKSKVQTQITVLNGKDTYFYGVWIKIIPESPQRIQSRITITPQTFDPNKTIESEGRYICLDLFEISGFDSSGQNCIWIYILTLGPSQSKSFLIDITEISPNEKITDKTRLSFQVVDSGQNSPIPLSMDGNLEKGEAETYFKPPGNIKVLKVTPLVVAKKKQ